MVVIITTTTFFKFLEISEGKPAVQEVRRKTLGLETGNQVTKVLLFFPPAQCYSRIRFWLRNSSLEPSETAKKAHSHTWKIHMSLRKFWNSQSTVHRVMEWIPPPRPSFAMSLKRMSARCPERRGGIWKSWRRPEVSYIEGIIILTV